MSLLNPAALFLLLIALPITLLYVLRVRLRRVPVSSLMFWQKALADQPPRAFWQRFRHLASWLVTLLLLVLLTLSAADIRMSSRAMRPQRLVLVLDVSSSMAANSGGTSRLDAARQAALQRIAELSDDDEAAVIAAGSTPMILCSVTSHQPTLRRAIAEAEQTPGTGRLPDAILLAQRIAAGAAGAGAAGAGGAAAAGGETGRVVVFSDGCGEFQPHESVEWQTFGEAQPNVGFTAFQVRRSPSDPLGYELLMRVQNAADAAVRGRVEVERDGVPLDVIPISIAANGEWTQVISKLSAEGGRLRAELTALQFEAALGGAAPVDGLVADNTAWALLPARPRQRVLLVSPGSLFVQKVLEANPLVDLTVWSELPEAPVWPADTLVVLHELVPPVLPPGPLLVLDPRGSCDLWTLSGEANDPVLETVQSATSWMRNVRLEQVLIPSASVLDFASPPQVLAEATGGVPLYAAVRRANAGPVLVLSIRFGGSDLAYRTVFPILVANALNEFAGESREVTSAFAAGETARLVLQADEAPRSEGTVQSAARLFSLRAPSGELQQLRATASSGGWELVTEPLQEAGIWEVSTLSEFAVNAVHQSEVDLRPAAAVSSADRTATASSWLSGGAVTRWLCLLLLMFLAVEWALHQRRWLA